MNKRLINQLKRDNTENPEFKVDALKILKDFHDLFIFTRYSANKDFFHITSEFEFDNFLNSRVSKECITLFRNKFKIIARGVINDYFIRNIKNSIKTHIVDWVIIGKEDDGTQWSCWISDEDELNEAMEDEFGKEVLIIEDQDWFNEEETIHAYVPDEDGVVRPGAY